MTQPRELLWIGLLACSGAGCSAPLEKDDIGAMTSPIVGGQETPTCAWPTTVHSQPRIDARRKAGCTATLVHPRW